MYQWRCSRCGAIYAPDSIRYTCPRCGEMAFLDMLPDYAAIAAAWGREDLAADARRSIWRYGPLLPLGLGTWDLELETRDLGLGIGDWGMKD